MKCKTCGSELTNKESLERHRGSRCHMVFLEDQLFELRGEAVKLQERVELLEKLTAELLEREVQEFIWRGYKPEGGVVVTNDGNRFLFAQAMTRRNK